MPAKTFRQLVLCQLLLLLSNSSLGRCCADEICAVDCADPKLSSLWEVSSRHLCARIDEHVVDRLAYHRYASDDSCVWQDSTSQELLGQVSTTTELSHVKQTVVVYAHGNSNSIGQRGSVRS